MGDTSASQGYTDLPASDAACAGCGYCLRGQPLTGTCPECGVSVAASAARVADRLAGVVAATGTDDARRLSDLRAGPWLLLAAWACAFGADAGIVIATRFAPGQLGTGDDLLWQTIPHLAAWVLGLAGLFVCTRPPRGVAEPPPLRWLRRAARWAAALCVALPPVITVLINVSPQWNTPPADAAYVLALVLLASTVAATAALFAYVAALARAGRQPTLVVPALALAVVMLSVGVGSVVATAALPLGWGPHSLVGHFVELPVPGVGPASPSVLHSWRPTGAGPFVLSLLSNAASYWTPLLFLQLAIVARGTRQREAPRP